MNFLKFFFKFLEIFLKFLNFFLKILNFLINLARDLRAIFLIFVKFFLKNFLFFLIILARHLRVEMMILCISMFILLKLMKIGIRIQLGGAGPSYPEGPHPRPEPQLALSPPLRGGLTAS